MGKIRFDVHRCKGCGLCVIFCPQKNLRMSAELNEHGHPYAQENEPGHCNGCGLCFRMCPDAAIEVDQHRRKTQTQE
ncbi:MAG: ferredoxin family protein [Planctomycetaceae bacterium]|nr:ferredoxin family protein [Planctomycetaceae bacterium]